jgi:hypothetical protein
MGTRKQRAARYARRVEDRRVGRERLKQALDEVPAVLTPGALREHMAARGFIQGLSGKWERATPVPETPRHDRKRGPVTQAIMARRKLKQGRN